MTSMLALRTHLTFEYDGYHHRLRCLSGTNQSPIPINRTNSVNIKSREKSSSKISCVAERHFSLAGAKPAQQLSLRLAAARADLGGNDMV